MKRLLFLSILFLSLCSYAQNIKPLSKKETKEFVLKMKGYISDGDYETAIDLYKDKSSIIQEKSIAKADREWWKNTIAELIQRDQLFKNNEGIVTKAKNAYSNGEYWNCNKIIKDLRLDQSCASRQTIADLNTLNNRMQPKLSTLSSVNTKMPEIIDLYRNNQIEQLFLDFFNDLKLELDRDDIDILEYVSPEYLSQTKAIINTYETQYVEYYNLFYKTVISPDQAIENFPSIKDMGHNEAIQCLDFYSNLVTQLKENNNFPTDEFPFLAEQQKRLLNESNVAIPSLQKRIKDTDPVASIMKGKPVTLSQIKKDCSKVDDNIKSILSLNVVGYYHKAFSTDLQVEMFKESDEYKLLYKELQQVRKKTLNTVYYSSLEVKIEKYYVEDGCFYIKIGSNDGVPPLLPGWSPTVSHSNEIEGVVHEALKIVPFTNNLVSAAYVNGDKSYTYTVKVPVPKATAVDIENTEGELVVCFMPAGIKTYRCMGASYNGRREYEIFYANKEYPYSQKCRLMLFSKDGKLIYDRML